ncbi:hypothetical protein KAX17_05215 [Candidatus Bipolaricaulota bacterium]|nr:hypothetical protein [Candidatus Bipolaricaulota bacterium]
MTVYAVQELPNIDDPDLVRCCVCAQDMRRTVSAFMQHIISQLGSHPVTTPIRVALAIMDRLAEGSLSVELLCLKNRVRDGAILLLSLHELKLDLQYIALDLSRADTWLDHTQEKRKPWRVASQMQEIYTAPNELDAERWLYRQYSMVKHCNPVGENFAFPIAAKRDMLQLDRSRGNSPMVRVHMFALGVYIHDAGSAAARIWASEDLDVGDYADRLNEQCERLSKYNEQHILSVLKQIAASQPPDRRQP